MIGGNFVKHIMRNLSEGVIVTDRRGRVIFINESAKMLIRSGRPINRKFYDFIEFLPGGDLFPHDIPLPDLFSEENDGELDRLTENWTVSSAFIRIIPTEIITETLIVPVRNGNDKFDGLIFITGGGSDTERLRDMENRLRLESIGGIASGFAHDYNNILTVIMGNLSLLRETDPSTEEFKALLTEAEKGLEKARILTRQLMELASTDYSYYPILSFANTLRNIVLLTLSGTPIRCSFEINVENYIPAIGLNQFSLIIMSVVRNAVESMPSGGYMNVSARIVHIGENSEYGCRGYFPDRCNPEPGPYIEICIGDTGAGIDPDIVPMIFEPFFSTKDGHKGLGLTLVYSLLRRMGGYIAVESEPGEGTSVRILLPAVTPDDSGKAGHEGPIKPKRILILEDEPLIIGLLERILSKKKIDADIVDCGEKVYELFVRAKKEGRPYDLLILDLTVKGGYGGSEVIKEIRKIDPEIKAIACSGYTDNDIFRNYKKYGFDGILVKPYTVDDLKKFIGGL